MLLFQTTLAANVKIDGMDFSGAKLIGSVTYVPIRAFCNTFNIENIQWIPESKTVKVTNSDVNMIAKIGDKHLEAKGRYVYSGNSNIIIDGSTYVPLRSVSKILGAKVDWDAQTKTAHVASGSEVFADQNDFYNASDLYWLAKIINAESEGESLEGKIAVGNVVMNRVKSNEFPNTIYDVIFDQAGGVQFTPVANGTIHKSPTDESIIAAKICLEDYKLSKANILFFLNPEISTSTWVPDNRDFVMTIGRHDFYA